MIDPMRPTLAELDAMAEARRDGPEPGFAFQLMLPVEVPAAEVVSPAGYLRGLVSVLGGTTTTDRPEDLEDYRPEDDEPWTVIRDMPTSAPLSWHRELADPP